MKRCVSCGKDIVDAAVNCVFCGSKQTAQAAANRTVLGFSTPSAHAARSPGAGAGPAPVAFTPAPLTPQPFTPPPASPGREPAPPSVLATPAPVRATSSPPTEARHQLYPFEPWATALRTVMIAFGIVLLGTAAAPWKLGDALAFAWEPLLEGSTTFRAIYPVAVGVAGLLALVLGIVPLVPAGRGALACLAGFGLLVAPPILARDFRLAGTFAITVVAAAGLLVRAQYRAALAGRLVATVGALGTLAAFAVPLPSGAIPVKVALDGLGRSVVGTISAGTALAAAALAAGTIVAAWLPQRTSAAGTLLAWLWIVLMPAGAIAVAVATLSESVLPGTFFEPAQALALQALAAFGLATLVGKGCEQRP